MTQSATLPARLEAAADRAGSITFVTGDNDGTAYSTERVPWSRLHDEARAMAAALQARGAGPGVTVGLLGPTSRALVTAIQATWLAGATVAMLPLPMRLGSIDEFVEATRRRVQHADARIVLVDPALADFVPPGLEATRLDELGGDAARFSATTVDPESLAILQFTSGSTADPKGVMLPASVRHREHGRHHTRGRVRRRARARRLLAPAVSRHGPDRSARGADDHRRRPRARRPAGLPRGTRRAGSTGCRPSSAR